MELIFAIGDAGRDRYVSSQMVKGRVKKER
jgi:hypothetical protein